MSKIEAANTAVKSTKEKVPRVIVMHSHVGIKDIDATKYIPITNLASCTVTVDKKLAGSVLKIVDNMSQVIATVWMDDSTTQNAYTALQKIAEQLLNATNILREK